jgi:hypothetical protein
MGNTIILSEKVKINNNIIKILSYNVRLILSGFDIKKKEICDYIINKFSKSENIIICAQGLDNLVMRNDILDELKNIKNINIISSQNLDNIIITKLNIINSKFETFEFNESDYKNFCLTANKEKILIKLTDVVKRGIIIANIVIDNTIISIYNVHLHEDIVKYIMNSLELRQLEILNIKKQIAKNIDTVSLIDKKFVRSKIHIIAGNFNIPEVNNKLKNVSDEYSNMINTTNFIDIYRLTNKESGITYIDDNERIDYLFFYLEEKNLDLVDISINSKQLLNLDQIIQIINNNYHIKIVSSYVKNYINFSNHYPVELLINIQNLQNNNVNINNNSTINYNMLISSINNIISISQKNMLKKN